MMNDNDVYGAGNAYTTKNRELDDRLDRWWSIDPVTHAYQSSYLSMSDNPILNKDPNGDDDYSVDKKGNISLKNKTKDKSDKLFATDDKGNMLKNKFIIVPKNSLNQKNNDKDRTYDQYAVKNDAVAKNIFTFLANNTNVEWEVTMVGDKKGVSGDNILTTSHGNDRVAGGGDWLLNSGYKIRGDYHNHPYGAKQGNEDGPSINDVDNARSVLRRYENAILQIYYAHPVNKWQRYDSTKIQINDAPW